MLINNIIKNILRGSSQNYFNLRNSSICVFNLTLDFLRSYKVFPIVLRN